MYAIFMTKTKREKRKEQKGEKFGAYILTLGSKIDIHSMLKAELGSPTFISQSRLFKSRST